MEYVIIGKIINTHGLKGLMRIEYYFNNPEKLKELKDIYIGNTKDKHEIINIINNKKILIEISNISDINQAEKFKNESLYIEEKKIDLLMEEGEYLTEDIIGLQVYDVDNNLIGKVTNIYKTGKNDVYEIDNDINKLIPATEHFIKEINLEERKMRVELIEGLIK